MFVKTLTEMMWSKKEYDFKCRKNKRSAYTIVELTLNFEICEKE